MNSLQTYTPKSKDILGVFEMRREAEHRHQMRKEIANEIDLNDGILFETSSRDCPLCRGKMHGHGRCGSTSYLASCGEVRIRLRRLRCVNCGHIVVPGEGLIPEDGISAGLGEKMCDLASKMPYAKATESLSIQHGIHMSVKRYWTFVQKEAALIGDLIEEEADSLYENGIVPDAVDLEGKKPLIIGIDGGHVRGWKTNLSFEVKCATIATGSVKESGKRRRLSDRIGYAAECTVEEFSKRISTLAIKSGYLTAETRIFVSDGAYWISKMIADWFPDAIHILDMYHLKNKIQKYFGLKAEGVAELIRDDAVSACDRYDPDLLINIISAWKPESDYKKEELRELIMYIENNALAIRNHSLVFIHGSGWIEKGVDLMISRRLKNRCMSWTKQGCSHMIPFAVLRYNRQWGVYWNKRKGLNLDAAAC